MCFRNFHILFIISKKSMLKPKNTKNVILPIIFSAFWGIFHHLFKRNNKIWKFLIFCAQISYFMKNRSKMHNKAYKFQNRLFMPLFLPFWTPVNFWNSKFSQLNFFFQVIFDTYMSIVLGETTPTLVFRLDLFWEIKMPCEMSI